MLDLSPQFFQYLSPNLILQLLTILQQKQIYPADFITQQQYKILSQTAQFDKAAALHAQHSATLPPQDTAAVTKAKADFDKRSKDVLSHLGEPLLKLITECAALSTRDLSAVKRENVTDLKITTTQLTALAQYAALQVECGEYLSGAIAYYLYFLTAEGLVTGPNALTKEIVWRMMEAALLSQAHHGPFFDLFFKKMRDIIDTSLALTIAQQTHQRVTYLVWVLYAFTTNPPQNVLVALQLVWSDMIYSQQSTTSVATSTASSQINNERLLNALLFQTPSLLRYVVLSTLIAAKVPSSQAQPWFLKRSPFFKELTRVLTIQYGADKIEQKDPVIKFFQQMFVEFNIKAAVETLNNDIPQVFKEDPFLSHIPLQVEFYEACKAVLVDMTMKLYTKLTLSKLQELLPITAKCEGFDPVITLGATAAKDAPVAPAVESTDATTEPPEEEVQEVAAGVFTSPLLLKDTYHNNLLKRLKTNNAAKR